MSFQIRTVDEIFQSLLQEQQNLTGLSNLIPNGIIDEATLIPKLQNGLAPEFILWLYNTAIANQSSDVQVQTGIDDINTIFETKEPGTERWYIEKALEFQYPDTLSYNILTGTYGYATIDENLQIIGSCTANSIGGILYLKIRGKNIDLLTQDELDAFVGYINLIKFAGSQVIINNFDGDLMTLNMNIVYNGSIPVSTISTNVEETIDDYLQNLEFDSKFITSSLIDRLQNTEGVIDPQFNISSAVDPVGNDVEFLHEYVTNAGWAQINPATPLSTTITYQPK